MEKQKKASSIFECVAKDLDGKDVKLDKYKGKCIIIVNIASDCKLWLQNFGMLKKLKQNFPNDLAILMFPCNQFLGMPMNDPSQIAEFTKREEIDFADLFACIEVNGPESHPLYRYLKSQRPGCISWNFTKFLVDKSGKSIERFSHNTLSTTITKEVSMLVQK